LRLSTIGIRDSTILSATAGKRSRKVGRPQGIVNRALSSDLDASDDRHYDAAVGTKDAAFSSNNTAQP